MREISPFNRERLACAWFFAVPGLVYGIFTSRLPAIKSMVEASDGQIGFLLLAFGGASFLGLMGSRKVMVALGAKKVVGLAAFAMPAVMTVAGLGINYWQLVAFCMLGGLASGFCDVAMNAQAIVIEQRYNRLCMSSLHACFSLGGLAGSLGGSLFAALNLSPAVNFLVVCGLFMLAGPLAYKNIIAAPHEAKEKGKRGRIPAFIYLCGLISMLCYVSEGSVAEWGSILLHSVKGAPEDQAALVFGCFCLTMVVFRFLGDRLRQRLGDVRVVLFGGLLAFLCMSAVLLASSPLICLAAYTVMGMGCAPIVPILFSRAGTCPGISPAQASSTVAIMSYTGLLVFPPFLGMLGDGIGLDNALWIIACAFLCVTICGPLLLGRRECLAPEK